MPFAKLRLPRFRRAKDHIASFHITSRDLEILRQVAAYRFLRSHHIASLVHGSTQQTLRRLQLLFHHGYLERPRAQLTYFHTMGSEPLVYGLSRRGASLLRQELNLPFNRMGWVGKNKEVGRLFLEHALMVSEIMVSLELACRASGKVRLIAGDQLNASAQIKRDPFHWSVFISSRHKVGVVPDSVFALEHADLPSGQNRAYFFLEADRSTMPVMRQSLEQSSLYRKLLAYEATWSQNLHRTRFGFHRFRVLTVTTSSERSRHIAAAARDLERGHGLFLFTDLASLMSSPDVTAHQWMTPRADETDSLLIA
jgi:hypothetical protein